MAQLGAKIPQVGAQMSPTPINLKPGWPSFRQIGTKIAPRPSKLEPRWPQDPPKFAPRCP
eukprot:7861391-Karenia_brevis.AAC.1